MRFVFVELLVVVYLFWGGQFCFVFFVLFCFICCLICCLMLFCVWWGFLFCLFVVPWLFLFVYLFVFVFSFAVSNRKEHTMR